MMYVKTGRFALAAALVSAVLVAQGWVGYRLLMDAGFKAAAENLLFADLCALILALLAIFQAAANSRAAKRSLERAAELAAMSGKLPQDRMRRLGSLGALIERLFAELQATSERKTVKIREQDAAISSLLSLSEVPTLILNARGSVAKANEAFSGAYGFRTAPPTGRAAAELFPGVDFPHCLREAARTEEEQRIPNPGGPLSLHPVALPDRPPSSYVLVVGKGRVVAGGAEEDKPQAKTERSSLAKSLERIAGIVRKRVEAGSRNREIPGTLRGRSPEEPYRDKSDGGAKTS